MDVHTVHANRLDPSAPGPLDHVLGERAAVITLVEYGSYHCPFCRAAHDVIASLRDRFGIRMCYVFRHRPITGDHIACRAAELAEYAQAATGRFWDVHEELMARGPDLLHADCDALEARLSLTPDVSTTEARREARAKVESDIASGTRSGAQASPTFFINNRRYDGPWDEASLSEAMLGSLGHRVQTVALDFARWAPSTGLLLLLMSLLALVVTNSPAGPAFEALWRTPIGLAVGHVTFSFPLRDWINDGLLTVFFLVVGLEIKRELTVGRLATWRAAGLPVAAAIGGLLVPALIYLLLVPAGPLSSGWAIPTTTDTALAVGLIALLGTRVPVELRIFLTATVVVDDLVAIALVSWFYATHFDAAYASVAVIITASLVLLNRSGIYRALPYAVLGVVLWCVLHAAGLHATLAGVILAVVTPTRPPANIAALLAQAESVVQEEMRGARDSALRHGPSESTLRAVDAIHDRIESPANKLLRSVVPWSSYVVLPIFAFANAGFAVSSGMVEGREALVAAIFFGLVLGKPVGILAACAIAVRAGLAVKPGAYSWMQLAGAGMLAGIGFTVSLYISGKTFPDESDFMAAKAAILMSSVIAGALGTALLWTLRSHAVDTGIRASDAREDQVASRLRSERFAE